jgi:hypothetical protein
MSLPQRPPASRFLAQLPQAYRKRFVAGCETVELKLADILIEAGEPVSHVYFPTASFISQIAPVNGNDEGLEVALVGDEGMFGLQVGLGVDVSHVRGLVQGAGPALRMGAKAFATQLDGSAALRKLIARYTFVVMKQIVQTAACTRYHVIEQRLARWLLMTADRAHSQSFDITQAFLAAMLGVRRVGVTTAAAGLSARGLIRYSRGHIVVLDRKGLERAACTCYRADVDVYRQIMGPHPAGAAKS